LKQSIAALAAKGAEMHIKNSNSGSKSITLPQFDGLRVTFTKNGHANVPDAVGRHLLRTCPSIEEVGGSTAKRSRRSRTTAVKGDTPVSLNLDSESEVEAVDVEAPDADTQKDGE